MTSTQDKARKIRENQTKSDIRTRNIVVGLLVLVLVALVTAVVFIVANRPTSEKLASDLPSEYQNGAPIIVSSEGIGKDNPQTPTLDLYFDYTCPSCVNLEIAMRPLLVDGALSGEFDLAYHPVMTAGGAYNVAATAGALAVASMEPDLFLDFQDALTDYFYDNALEGGESFYQDLEQSKEVVRTIAEKVGVDGETISSFNTDAAAGYLDMTTHTWANADIDGREQVGTPEFVANSKNIEWGADSPEGVMANLLAALGASPQSN